MRLTRVFGGIAAATIAVAAGIACSNLRDPPLPAGTERFVPPSIYTRWWGMVESCSSITRPVQDVQWYSVPGTLRDPHSGLAIEGYYSHAGNRIVQSGNRTLDGSGVRHEMLHALLRSKGHSRAAFLHDCAGVVACGAECVHDAGAPSPQDPATPTVAPSELEVSSSVAPEIPISSIDGGLFTFIITVRNPFPHPVVAMLPLKPDGDTTVSYPYEIRDSHGGLRGADLALDPGVTYFAAGETKRAVIDVAVAPGVEFPSTYSLPGQGAVPIALSPGTYTFRGAYGDHWAPDLVVMLQP